MSSRNRNLTFEQRQAAPALYRALQTAKLAYDAGERDPDVLRAQMQAVLAAEPLAQVDYISVADARALQELHDPITRSVLVSLAVNIGPTRLIDNIILGE